MMKTLLNGRTDSNGDTKRYMPFRLHGAYFGEGKSRFRYGDAGIAIDVDRDHTFYLLINRDGSFTFKLQEKGEEDTILAETPRLMGLELIEFLDFDPDKDGEDEDDD
jgi:hypothetical protein